MITKKDEETIRNFIHGRDRHGAPMKKHPWIWRALLRGVACHHPALKIEYRRAVEYFFRMKRLSLVFATDTLGQGINMPCRRWEGGGEGREGAAGSDLCVRLNTASSWPSPVLYLSATRRRWTRPSSSR